MVVKGLIKQWQKSIFENGGKYFANSAEINSFTKLSIGKIISLWVMYMKEKKMFLNVKRN